MYSIKETGPSLKVYLSKTMRHLIDPGELFGILKKQQYTYGCKCKPTWSGKDVCLKAAQRKESAFKVVGSMATTTKIKSQQN